MHKIMLFKPYVNAKAVELAAQALRSGWVGEGAKVQEFEKRIGDFVHAPYPLAVNSGTAALHLALLAAHVGPGDEVITTAQTMLATTQAILAAGATPVYADIEYATGNLDSRDVVRHITPATKAILAVDWAGYPCDYDALLQIAQEHGLVVIEDAAHALGAVYRGKPAGATCPFTCFSFQAIKHLTTGDGGLLCVPDSETHRRALQLRWFGIDRHLRKPSVLGEAEWNVTELGYKYHMNDVAASIGLGNLEDLEFILSRRRAIVQRYRAELASVPGVALFERAPDRQSGDWLFSIHVQRRPDFCRMLAEKEIMASVVHLRIDRNGICGGERQDLPELTRFTETHVSLPLHPGLSDADVDAVIQAVRSGW